MTRFLNQLPKLKMLAGMCVLAVSLAGCVVYPSSGYYGGYGYGYAPSYYAPPPVSFNFGYGGGGYYHGGGWGGGGYHGGGGYGRWH